MKPAWVVVNVSKTLKDSQSKKGQFALGVPERIKSANQLAPLKGPLPRSSKESVGDNTRVEMVLQRESAFSAGQALTTDVPSTLYGVSSMDGDSELDRPEEDYV